ncbi:hypothetical protein HGH93_05290 [Chitinophaga polysaccharea]|uniref:hypothetical protein n=1 Tax=Chitinophaga TaxID=79328 RepID=UPI001455D5D6|nr:MULTISPECIES: hypothetical protein [Chitinophaga]NLR57500.1 hypothetical protein [Chitinophaga polysaccharea]NLU95414.1 hypothetical protein [Chitinophaga sp. Ak27]
MDSPLAGKWFRWGLLNLAVVALYGTLMRYKIAFSLPFLEQNNLLHAHSHFAFSAWITHVLYSGLALVIAPFITSSQQKRYRQLIILNLVCSFGMLIAFTVQGYKAVSISFSTLAIVIGMAFAGIFLRDTKYLPVAHPAKPWAITGLLLNVLSSAGPFFLAYMMATKDINHRFYLGSVYYYLHFQYNGWFFFGSMALAAARFPAVFEGAKKYFRVFVIAVIPTFFLSMLWAKLPFWLYIVTVAAAALQLLAWIIFLRKSWLIFRQQPSGYPGWINFLFCAATWALTIKFLLQTISVIPSLSQLVFGFRPVVIAYLHLVLLGVYSLFLIGYMLANGLIKTGKRTKTFSFVFFSGVLFNELLLAVQGFAAFFYIPVPQIREMLFVAALILLGSATALFFSQAGRRR